MTTTWEGGRMQKLDDLMKERGKSTKDLVEFLDTTYTIAWNKKSGRTELTNFERKAIAKWLGVSEKELEA